MRRILISALVLFCWLVLSAPAEGERLPVKIFTSADGLGSSFVDCLMRDSRGFLWFCTRDGLSRFDGANFITYQLDDKSSSPGIETMFEDRHGRYWITTIRGLYRFNPNSPGPRRTTEAGRPVLNVEYIGNWHGHFCEDRNGVLWFVANGFYRVTEADGKVDFERVDLNLPIAVAPEYEVQTITEASDGSLWMVCAYGLVRRLPDGRSVLYRFRVTEGAAALEQDRQGRIWARLQSLYFVLQPEPLEAFAGRDQIPVRDLNLGVVALLRPEQPLQLPAKSGEVIKLTEEKDNERWARGLYETSDGHMWLDSDTALYEYDGHVIHRYSASQGLPPTMFRMTEDTAGNLWIGGQAGLVRLDRKGLTSFGEADGLKSARLFSINESAGGRLFITNGDYYVSELSGEQFHTVQLIPSHPMLWTSRVAYLDSRGEWWVMTTEKLVRLAANDRLEALDHARPVRTYTSLDGLKSNSVFQTFEDKRGDIWVSTRALTPNEQGLAKFDRAENRFHTFTETEGYPAGKSPGAFAEDLSGNLWFGFYEGGVARYAGGRFTVFGEEYGVPGRTISDLHVDRKGRLWLSSSISGLFRLDDPNLGQPKFVNYSTANGLASNNIRTITEDLYGNIYLGTVRGVDRLTPETGHVKHYSISDGLASDFVVDSHRDRNGVLWFATTNGLSRLMPQPGDTPGPPQVWIGGLRVSGLAQQLAELGTTELGSLELTHTQNSLQIDFYGLEFRPGETLRYQYKLEGAGGDWSLPSEQRTVTFATLQPGAYRFLVRAVNSDGIASTRPALLSFTILRPFWLRWWFIALAVLLLLVMLYLVHRVRLQRLAEAKRNEEALSQAREERLIELARVRTRIATDLHDDIGASLTQISILSEVVRQQMKGNGASLEPLNSIVNVSNELVETMSDIVWAINPKKDHLPDLIQRMRRFASDLLAAKGLSFEFNAPEEAPEIPLGANARREVFLIFKESLANVVKHSGATRVEIDLTLSLDYLTLRVADNGRGFDAEKVSAGLFSNQKGGHGVISMKKRAAEMRSGLKIESRPGLGTTITLQLPLQPAARNAPAAPI